MSDWFVKEVLEESYAREKALQRAARVWDVRVYTLIGIADMLIVLWMLSNGNLLGAAVLGIMVSACVVAVRRAKKWLMANRE